MRRFLALLVCAGGLWGHPMGNFSVNHFSKLRVTSQGIDLQYVLDLAEIPTFELLGTWKVDRTASPQEISQHATIQARDWLSHLSVTANGHPVRPRLESVRAAIADGAGNLPIIRVDMRAVLDTKGGRMVYEDGNYAERAGWKEIVIDPGNKALLSKVSQSDKDLSKALTQYPPDPTIAPPQDLRAELEWKKVLPVVASSKPQPTTATTTLPKVMGVPQPHLAPAAVAPATMTMRGAPAGSVTRGDFLSRLLHQKQLTLSMILIALAAAFGLGAAHALTPGHGKAIVAAYLVGSRGTLKHAAFLAAMVTFTHTVTVFALGLATLFLFRFLVPEKITALLGAVSGLSIVVVGALMFYKRVRQPHARAHDHKRRLANNHSHLHNRVHTHRHGSGAVHTHSHGLRGVHSHAHVPEQLSWGGLIALGASGGLVPCESALVLLLGAMALGRVGLGLLLLLSFSLGLALVLMLIGVLVLYAKNLLPADSRAGAHPILRWASIASPAVVMILGLLVTAASLGWIQSKWMIA